MITIGIPTFNEEKVITKAINSVLPQISSQDEIIVVASGCTDNTIPRIKEIIKRDKRVKLIIEKKRKGKSSAINRIIKRANGEIIVQIDGDVEILKGAINKLIKHFSDEEVGAVTGNPIPIIYKENLFYDWTIMSYRKIGEIREEEMKQKTFNIHLSGYLIAFRKKALKKVPFAKGAIDVWMGNIIRENGYKLTYEPEAYVYVKAPLTIKDFVNQKARVRAGYYFLPKGPRTVKKEILYFPRELLKISIWRWPKFFISGFIYAYSWVKGYYLAKTNKSLNEIWKAAETTKI